VAALARPSGASSRAFWRRVLVATDAGLSDEMMACDAANTERNRVSMRSLLHRVAAPSGVRRAMLADDAWPHLADRCVMLWGDQDKVGRADVARERLSHAAAPPVVDIPGAGHLPWLDQPSAIVDHIRGFLRA